MACYYFFLNGCHGGKYIRSTFGQRNYDWHSVIHDRTSLPLHIFHSGLLRLLHAYRQMDRLILIVTPERCENAL